MLDLPSNPLWFDYMMDKLYDKNREKTQELSNHLFGIPFSASHYDGKFNSETIFIIEINVILSNGWTLHAMDLGTILIYHYLVNKHPHSS